MSKIETFTIKFKWADFANLVGIALDVGLDPKGREHTKRELNNMAKVADSVEGLVTFIEKVVKEQVSHGSNGDMTIINEGSELLSKFGIKIK